VIATRCPSVIDDLAADAPAGLEEPLPVRSTISVPMLVKDELVGTLSVAAADPYRFERDDEHLLRIIAGQIGVAVQNARLHDVVRRGKQEWEHTFDAISDAIAVFDSRGRLLRGTVRSERFSGVLSRSSTLDVPQRRVLLGIVSAVCRWRGRDARRVRAVRGHARNGEIQRHDVSDRRRG
jgi:GAF domain-containing protein